jgi:hypothetical protein
MKRWALHIVFAVLVMLLSGCSHTTYIADSKNPEVEFSEDGGLMWRGRFIELHELPDILEDAGVDKKSQIDIRVSERMRSLKAPRALLFMLRRRGYTRGVLVTKKRAYSEVTSPPPQHRQPVHSPQRRTIRYK